VGGRNAQRLYMLIKKAQTLRCVLRAVIMSKSKASYSDTDFERAHVFLQRKTLII
jgi:hypothetical protein